MRVPTIFTNDVLFHEPRRRILQDVVTCIRHNVTIDELGDRRERHADRYLKSSDEMHRLFARYPEALARTVQIVDSEESADPSLTPQETLESLTWGARPGDIPRGCQTTCSKPFATNSISSRSCANPVLPDRPFDRALCTVEGHSLPGPRQRRK
jgi:hypothetical protein